MDLRLEQVARALDLVLRDNIVQALTDVDAEMTPEDTAYFTAIGEPVPTTPMDPPASFALGHQPLILERPLDQYPSLAVMCEKHGAVQVEEYDQIETTESSAFVELYVVHQDESTINRMSWRYAKALHRIVTEHKDLGGAVQEISRAPQVQVSNAIQRRASPTSNDVWFAQGVRLDVGYHLHDEW